MQGYDFYKLYTNTGTVCKVKSACTHIIPVKRLTGNSIYSLKFFFLCYVGQSYSW
jgi:hypothetical protein